jgi:sirohydrochlorin cobaltochelatase
MMGQTLVRILGPVIVFAGCTSSAMTGPAAPADASRTSGTSRTSGASGTSGGDAPARDFGVLLMAHGGSPEWNAAVLEAVKPLRARYDIEVAFGMADATSLQDSVTRLEARSARKIGVVRLFVSGESFLDETEKVLGLRPGAPPAPAVVGHAARGGHGGHAGHAGHGGHAAPAGHAGHGGHSMAFHRVATRSSFALSTNGLADSEGMAAILADRVAALSKAPAREDVLILGHGPGDDAENTRWLAKLDARARAVRSRGAFRRVQVETLREDWPDKRAEAEARIRAFVKRAADEGGKAIVIPFRVQGFGPYAEVLEGLDYVADRQGLIPHAEVTKWIEQEIAALEAGEFRAVRPPG